MMLNMTAPIRSPSSITTDCSDELPSMQWESFGMLLSLTGIVTIMNAIFICYEYL